jgi:hypothetical protein
MAQKLSSIISETPEGYDIGLVSLDTDLLFETAVGQGTAIACPGD